MCGRCSTWRSCRLEGNRSISAFHDQLVARGKQRKVALVASMRKLLTILNAMTRTRTGTISRLTGQTVAAR
jgi:hypothetical protein